MGGAEGGGPERVGFVLWFGFVRWLEKLMIYMGKLVLVKKYQEGLNKLII